MIEPDLTQRVLALGRVLSPAMVEATSSIYRPLHDALSRDDVTVAEHAYGPHPRARLKIFTRGPLTDKPMLLFVPGGGLIAPIMAEPGGPFFDNVGLWAARNGMVGVTMSCRLAPEAKWPAGGEDVAAAIAWLHAHGARYGTDVSRLVLMGHSAGAGHVATYVANPALQGTLGLRIRGVVLISGPYNILTLPWPTNTAYYGDDPARYPACNLIPGIVRSGLPCLLAVAENDSPEFERQAIELLTEWQIAHGRLPRFVRMAGHNHFSIVQHIGLAKSALTNELADFVRSSA